MPKHNLKNRMILTLLLVIPSLGMSQKGYWHNIIGKQKSLELRTIANEVIIGLMSATLIR